MSGEDLREFDVDLEARALILPIVAALDDRAAKALVELLAKEHPGDPDFCRHRRSITGNPDRLTCDDCGYGWSQ